LKLPQEPEEIALYSRIREAEMQIGDDIRRGGEHALILARQLPHYKGQWLAPHAFNLVTHS
jgi:hypothetical protein